MTNVGIWPKTAAYRRRTEGWGLDDHGDEEYMPGDDGAVQQEARGFSVKETIAGRTVSNSKDDKCKVNVYFSKNHLLHKICSLQCRVKNLSIKKKEDIICTLQGETGIFLDKH